MRISYGAPAAVGLLAVLYFIPVVAPGQLYPLHILTLALCYAVPAIGLNLLFGYTGLVSLGHMGFAGRRRLHNGAADEAGRWLASCQRSRAAHSRLAWWACWSAFRACGCAATFSSS